jgi:hypothetical protein
MCKCLVFAAIVICGVMIRVFASNFWLIVGSSQTNDYVIGIYCYSAKRAALISKCKYVLVRNLNNVTVRGLLFQD